MRKYLLAIALLFSTQANAVTLTIGYELPSVTPGTVTPVASSADPVTGTLTTQILNNNWIVDASIWAKSTFDLQGTVNAALEPFNGLVSAFSVYITVSDITSPVGAPVTFTNTMIVPTLSDGWTLNRTVYIDDASAPDGGNVIFSKMSYLNAPQLYFTAGTEILSAVWTPAGPYSVTQFYGFQAVPSAPVPGPIVGAGLPGLAALASMTLLWLGRRRQRG